MLRHARPCLGVTSSAESTILIKNHLAPGAYHSMLSAQRNPRASRLARRSLCFLHWLGQVLALCPVFPPPRCAPRQSAGAWTAKGLLAERQYWSCLRCPIQPARPSAGPYPIPAHPLVAPSNGFLQRRPLHLGLQISQPPPSGTLEVAERTSSTENNTP